MAANPSLLAATHRGSGPAGMPTPGRVTHPWPLTIAVICILGAPCVPYLLLYACTPQRMEPVDRLASHEPGKLGGTGASGADASCRCAVHRTHVIPGGIAAACKQLCNESNPAIAASAG